MKHLSIFAILLVIVSCDKSNDPAGASIVGIWKQTSSESYNCDISTDNKVLTCGTYAWCSTFTFNSDETFVRKRTSDGATLGTGTYDVINGQLVFQYQNDPSPSIYTIKTLGQTTLVTDLSSATASCDSKDTYERQ